MISWVVARSRAMARWTSQGLVTPRSRMLVSSGPGQLGPLRVILRGARRQRSSVPVAALAVARTRLGAPAQAAMPQAAVAAWALAWPAVP
jgi:hypothetical protein